MNNDLLLRLQANRLLFLGILLFLIGLLTGLYIPYAANPRMGLSAHLEATQNGIFLVLLGLLWPKLKLAASGMRWAFGLAVYGTFANFIAIFLAAATGAGKLLPLAGGKELDSVVETIISFLLVSLALSMISLCVLLLLGLYRNIRQIA